MRIAVLIVALLLGAATTQAADTFDAGGIGKGTSANEQEVIGKGHVLIKSDTVYNTFEATDPNSPLSGMKGRCWGAIEVRAPHANGGGLCAFTTPSGDRQFSSWSVQGIDAKGAMFGSWVMLSGTGKLAGATGGGTFSTVADPKGKTFVNTIRGGIALR